MEVTVSTRHLSYLIKKNVSRSVMKQTICHLNLLLKLIFPPLVLNFPHTSLSVKHYASTLTN